MGSNDIAAEIRIEIVEEDEVYVKESVGEEQSEPLENRLRRLHEGIDDGLGDLLAVAGGEIEEGEMDSERIYKSKIGAQG